MSVDSNLTPAIDSAKMDIIIINQNIHYVSQKIVQMVQHRNLVQGPETCSKGRSHVKYVPTKIVPHED